MERIKRRWYESRLQWAPVSNDLSYDEAIMYCVFCSYGDYTDWRMPTEDEIRNEIYMNLLRSNYESWVVEDAIKYKLQLNLLAPVYPVRTTIGLRQWIQAGIQSIITNIRIFVKLACKYGI